MVAPQLRRLRLLSYNIQGGIDSDGYRGYLLHGWKHLVPHQQRLRNLRRIGALLGSYDLVALQEVDGGSLRTGFVDQTEYLAAQGGFPYWRKQVNRNLGKLARHSNGFVSKLPPVAVQSYALPGLPGRGAMVAEFGGGCERLTVCMLHLALSQRARRRQLAFIRERLFGASRLVVMGDLNCDCEAPELRTLTDGLKLAIPDCTERTYPSWRPRRRLDHILVSDGLAVEQAAVVDYPLSDHLPVALELLVPAALWGHSPKVMSRHLL